ncbi:MAG: metal-sensitive transcriptional regulator [Anaerolineae bacterium]|nr:metal-sensitive transcriptional regulator [Anaerolineae bacterium]
MQTEEITNRLKRIEGQVRGLQRMVSDERDCEAILTQLMAARAALDRVGVLIAREFVHECMVTDDPDLARDRVGRVMNLVFSRFSVPVLDTLPEAFDAENDQHEEEDATWQNQ